MPPKQKLAKIECPDCGSDNWQRVEVAYKLGTSEQSGTAVLAGDAGLNVGAMSGTSRTRFAEHIAPPPRHPATLAKLFLFLGGVVILGGWFVMALTAEDPLRAADHDNAQKALVGGVCLVALSILFFVMASKYNSTVWRRLMREWREHLVCLKCGCIWIPGQGP
jgi:hypothetical protein